jgi:hypothetical protein
MTDMTGRPISNYPLNHVVGFIHDERHAAEAQVDLEGVGYGNFHILRGESGLRQLDPQGSQPQGMLEKAKRLFQKLGDEETRLFKIAERQLRLGDSLIMVETNGDDAQIEEVRQVLVAHHAHSLVFFGELAVERLESAQAPAPVES